MLVYQYSLGDRDGAGLKTSAKTWISRSDNLPRKTESEGTINLAGKQVNTRTITTYYDYGADIKIERPRVGAGD